MRELETERCWLRTPIVALTSDPVGRALARQAGVNGVLPAPCSVGGLSRCLDHWSPGRLAIQAPMAGPAASRMNPPDRPAAASRRLIDRIQSWLHAESSFESPQAGRKAAAAAAPRCTEFEASIPNAPGFDAASRMPGHGMHWTAQGTLAESSRRP
ncbi:MAG: hypothetical protein KGL18_18550 [Burkholderiales bacterium]|nr:hypothetical protein [Burkholderiales bacterium]